MGIFSKVSARLVNVMEMWHEDIIVKETIAVLLKNKKMRAGRYARTKALVCLYVRHSLML